MGAGGTVRIRVTVAADGSVDRLEMTDGSGNRYLNGAERSEVPHRRARKGSSPCCWLRPFACAQSLP